MYAFPYATSFVHDIAYLEGAYLVFSTQTLLRPAEQTRL